MSCDWEGNRRSGVALAMRHGRKWFIHLRAQSLSTEALKEVMVLRIRLQSHQVHLTMLQYYTCMQCTVRHKIIHTQKMNLSRVKWAQWDKTQSRELSVLFICVCSSLCTIVAHNTAQNRPDSFPSCPPDNHHCSDDVYLRERGKMY